MIDIYMKAAIRQFNFNGFSCHIIDDIVIGTFGGDKVYERLLYEDIMGPIPAYSSYPLGWFGYLGDIKHQDQRTLCLLLMHEFYQDLIKGEYDD